MAAKWSIRNYNAFLRAARAKSDLTQGQAKNVYRQMSAKLGRPAIGADVKRHPRYFRGAERVATGATASLNRVTPGEKPRVTGGGGSGGNAPASLRQWDRFLDGIDYDFDYGFDEYESSADYGEV